MFLKEPLPAVGISLGVDRLIAALLELSLVAPRKTAADVFVALFDAEGYAEHVKIAGILRAHGLRAELSLAPDKLGKQFKLAERKGYRHVLISGPDERARGLVNVKDLAGGSQETLALADIAQWAPRFAL